MITLALSREKRARIWFDSPDGHLEQPAVLRSFRIKPKARVKQYKKVIVVEVLVPRGGRFEYGLLGATVLDAGAMSDEIVVEMPVTGSLGPIVTDSLAGRLETVRWGLPAEYAEAVAAGARASLLADGAPDAYGIRFAWAAHGLVGSSSHRFGRLATLVSRLIITPSEADMKGLVEQGMSD